MSFIHYSIISLSIFLYISSFIYHICPTPIISLYHYPFSYHGLTVPIITVFRLSAIISWYLCLILAVAIVSSSMSDVLLVFIMAYQARLPHFYVLYPLYHMSTSIFFSWINSSVYHAAPSFSVHFLYHWLSSSSIVLINNAAFFNIHVYPGIISSSIKLVCPSICILG